MPAPKKPAPPRSKPHEPTAPSRFHPPLKPSPQPPPRSTPPPSPPPLKPKPEPKPPKPPAKPEPTPEPEPTYQPVAMRHRMYGRKLAKSEAEYTISLLEGWTLEEKK